MTPPTHGYDESLLKSAPAASKAEKQEGYNVDLLAPSRPQGTSRSQSGHGHPQHQNSGDLERGLSPSQQQPPHQQAHSPPIKGAGAPLKRPWYRTTAGMVGIAVAVLVIIGAVVGGAVGGSIAARNARNAAAASTAVQGISGGDSTTAAPTLGAPLTPSTTSTSASTASPSAGTGTGGGGNGTGGGGQLGASDENGGAFAVAPDVPADSIRESRIS